MCDRGNCSGCGATFGSAQLNAPICPKCKRNGGCGNGPCSGCNVELDHWQCGYCSNDRTSQKAWDLANVERDAALRSGAAVIPPSGNFNFDVMGAWQPYGRACALNNNAGDFISPPGMHTCAVAPGVWTSVPNWVPCGAMINFYNDGAYIQNLYNLGRTMPFARGGGGGRAGMEGAYPVLNPYVWPPPFNPISDLYRR